MNCKAKVGASVLVLVWLSATLAFGQDVTVSDEARKHFQAGVAYLEEPTGARYEDAYLEFHAAYAGSPSYKILNNIGLCALFLERDGEAIDVYEKYLAAAPASEIPADKRKQIESDVRRLKSGVVTLTLKISPDDATVVDSRLAVQGQNIVNRYTPKNGELVIGIHPGRHRITVTSETGKEQTWEFEALPGSSHSRTITLADVNDAKPVPAEATVANVTVPPAEKPSGGVSTAAYVGLAVTGVFAAAATTTGLLALSKKNELETLNEKQQDPAAARDAHDDAKRLALLCDIGLGATVAAAGVTTYLFLSGGKSKEKVPERGSFVQWSPVLSPNAAGVNVTGRF